MSVWVAEFLYRPTMYEAKTPYTGGWDILHNKEALLIFEVVFITWRKDADELGKYQQIDHEHNGNITNVIT